MKKILVIAAHPDDEILGCGGTIAKYVKEKKFSAHALILAEGLTAREKNTSKRSKKYFDKLYLSAKKSSKIIGYSSLEIIDFPDNKLDTVAMLDVVKIIEKKISKIKPNIVFTHFNGDLNIDHQIVSNAVLIATRPVQNQSVKKIYAFETLSSTEWSFATKGEFSPNFFVNISNFIKTKQKALSAYSSEMRKFPHPRSTKAVNALANVRGSTSGYRFAEAFKVIRELKD